MTAIELYNILSPAVDEFSREPAYALAYLLVQEGISEGVWTGRVDPTPEAVAAEIERLRKRMNQVRPLARNVNRGRRLERLLRQMNDGTWQPPKRRRRRKAAKRSMHA